MPKKKKNRRKKILVVKYDYEEVLDIIRDRHKTITEFARILDVNRNNIYAALSGRDPHLKKLKARILDHLNISMAD